MHESIYDAFVQEIIFLCKEDIMEESAQSIEEAESESNIENFQKWWDEKLTSGCLNLDCMKEIIGK